MRKPKPKVDVELTQAINLVEAAQKLLARNIAEKRGLDTIENAANCLVHTIGRLYDKVQINHFELMTYGEIERWLAENAALVSSVEQGPLPHGCKGTINTYRAAGREITTDNRIIYWSLQKREVKVDGVTVVNEDYRYH